VNEINEKAKDVILSMFDENSAPVVFIGAGLSHPPYPLWEDLIQHLAKKIGYPERRKLIGDPLVAARILHEHDEHAFKQAIIDDFCPDPDPTKCSPALRNIARINFKAFLTTNFDRIIEAAFTLENRDCSGYYSSESNSRLLSSLCCSQKLFFLHGRVDEQPSQKLEVVFTKEEYDKAYFGAKGHVGTFLFDVFAHNNVIFTGFSLNKYEPVNYVLQAILRIREKFGIEASKKKWRILLPTEETRDSDFLPHIEVIYFDKVDESFSGLTWVWGQVADSLRWKNRTPLSRASDPIIKPNRGEDYV